MRSFATWITHHRKIVVWAWIFIMIGTGIAAGQVGSDFKEDFNLPKSDSQKAVEMLQDNFKSQSGDQGQVVVYSKTGFDNPAEVQKFKDVLAKVEKVDGVSAVTSPFSEEGVGQISPAGEFKGKIAYATINWSDVISQDKVEKQVDPIIDLADKTRSGEFDIQLGGGPFQLAQQSESNASETVGIIAAGIVLFIMFGTFLAMSMPLATAIVAVGTASSLIVLSSHIFSTAEFATFLSVMIGLGVGIDYALFIITRFRQGMRRGVPTVEAVITSMDTAGRAVLFAGITVMIALLGLFVVGISFLHGPAVAASATVLLTMSAALTLLPALLAMAGAKINEPFFDVLKGAIRRNAGKFKNGQVVSGIISIPLLLIQGVLLPLSYLLYGLFIWIPSHILKLLHIPVPSRRDRKSVV